MSKDLTEDQQHSLAPETLQTLAALPARVNAVAFFSAQTPITTAQQTLNDFKANSKGKFDYRFDDPTADPLLARQYGVTGDSKIVLLMGSQKEVTADASELEITRALVRLISPEQRTVYFLTGHGEADINGTDNAAMSRASQTLQSRNYSVKTLNLATTLKIPDDARVIVIAGPKNPLLDQEVVLLQAYVNKGGALVVMEDPTPFTSFGTNPDPLADYLKNNWGITLDNDVVIDTSSTNALVAIADPATYDASQAITQSTRAITVMPEARSLSVSKSPPQGVTLSPLMATTQQAQNWGETDFASIQNKQVAYDQATDIAGPLTLAASAANGNSRVVVFGNSVFATDAAFDQYANGDIFVNSVAWAAQQQNLLNITTHQSIQRTFNPPPPVGLIAVLLGSVCIIPGLIVGAGVYSWLARRRQG